MPTTLPCPLCGKPLAAGAPHGLCPSCLLKAGVPTGTAAPGGGRSHFTPPTPADLARDFPQLEILELIGQGGMGAVYRARQPSLDRIVALKILPPQTGGDPGFAERFTREARALARLSHANIVAVHDFGQAGAFPYLVMEFVDGVNLRHLLTAGKITPAEALAIVPPICDALQYAHDRGIVHRDIKPENILLGKNGAVKIADFGLAKLVGTDPANLSLTGERDVMGTPYYMAPEQVERPLEVDHRADIYSLGVVFYQMLTGELPLGRFAPPSRKVTIDVRLDEVVLRALEKSPEQRYQQASALKTEVEKIGVNEAGSSKSPDPAASPTTLAIVHKTAGILFAVHGFNLALLVYSIVQTLKANLVGSPVRSGIKTVGEAIAGAVIPKLSFFAVFFAPAIIASLVGLWAARCFSRRRLYGWSVAAAVIPLSLGPGTTALFPTTFPLGILGLWVLTRRAVQAAFVPSGPEVTITPAAWIRPALITFTVVAGVASGAPVIALVMGFSSISPDFGIHFGRGFLRMSVAGTLIAAMLAAIVARRWQRETENRTEQRTSRGIWFFSSAVFAAWIIAVSYVVARFPARDLPSAGRPASEESYPEFDTMESNPEILRERLRLAESNLNLVRSKFDAGLATSHSVLTAGQQVARFKAKLAGDRLAFARGDFEVAEKIFAETKSRRAGGVATDADFQTAEAEFRIAEIRLKQEEARVKATPAAGVGTANGR